MLSLLSGFGLALNPDKFGDDPSDTEMENGTKAWLEKLKEHYKAHPLQPPAKIDLGSIQIEPEPEPMYGKMVILPLPTPPSPYTTPPSPWSHYYQERKGEELKPAPK
jgi:hypothetical protein